jgi:hypothetical protein
MQCGKGTKKKEGGSERKKEKIGVCVCGCVRKKKRLAIQHTTIHHCLQKKKKKKKCSNKVYANANKYFLLQYFTYLKRYYCFMA